MVLDIGIGAMVIPRRDAVSGDGRVGARSLYLAPPKQPAVIRRYPRAPSSPVNLKNLGTRQNEHPENPQHLENR